MITSDHICAKKHIVGVSLNYYAGESNSSDTYSITPYLIAYAERGTMNYSQKDINSESYSKRS